MRMRLLSLSLLAVLAGCGSHSADKPAATSRVPTIRGYSGTIPPASPPSGPTITPPKRAKHGTPRSLPTLPPQVIPTATIMPARIYTASIHGTVTDAKTHAPISGAIISIANGQRIVRTDAFGRYHTKFPAGPNVSVQVTKNGFAAALAMGSLYSHQSTVLNFKLTRVTPGQPAAPQPPGIFGHLGH